MLSIKLEAPWYSWAKKAAKLFELDPDIIVGEVYELDGEDADYGIDIEVRNHEKFVALDRVLPSVKEFGNVRLIITLFDEENSNVNPDAALYETIFKGNPILDRVEDTVDHTGTHIGYVIFKPMVTQFFDDNLADYRGNWSGLAQDIAKDVFDNDFRGVYFCTTDLNEVKNDATAEVNKAPKEAKTEASKADSKADIKSKSGAKSVA